MMHGYDLASAQMAARAAQLEVWIQRYLTTEPWANHGLAEGLTRQQRWWRGPLEIPLHQVVRCCGPEAEMEFQVDPAGWEAKVGGMAASLGDLGMLPPLIVEYRGGLLSVRDGNHRHEAMRRRGWQSCWILVWYNNQHDYAAHGQTLPC